jgi:hypothetical protein
LSVMARVGEWSIRNVCKMEWGHSTIVCWTWSWVVKVAY